VAAAREEVALQTLQI